MSTPHRSHIVKEWLKHLELDYYIQEFIDNGYDELEICKQIGSDDLDAIGVVDDGDRQKILDAVSELKNGGGASLYHTLDSCETKPVSPYTDSDVKSMYGYGGVSTSCYGRGQSLNYGRCTPVQQNAGSFAPNTVATSPSIGAGISDVDYSPTSNVEQLQFGNIKYSSENYDSSSIYADTKMLGLHSIHSRHASLDSKTNTGAAGVAKKASPITRFLRNIGSRMSNKKANYKAHKGDPKASHITMRDDDRIAIMYMVKEGRLTTAQALELVKKYEKRHKGAGSSQLKDDSRNDPSNRCASQQAYLQENPYESGYSGREYVSFDAQSLDSSVIQGDIDYRLSSSSQPARSRSLCSTPTHIHRHTLDTPRSLTTPTPSSVHVHDAHRHPLDTQLSINSEHDHPSSESPYQSLPVHPHWGQYGLPSNQQVQYTHPNYQQTQYGHFGHQLLGVYPGQIQYGDGDILYTKEQQLYTHQPPGYCTVHGHQSHRHTCSHHSNTHGDNSMNDQSRATPIDAMEQSDRATPTNIPVTATPHIASQSPYTARTDPYSATNPNIPTGSPHVSHMVTKRVPNTSPYYSASEILQRQRYLNHSTTGRHSSVSPFNQSNLHASRIDQSPSTTSCQDPSPATISFDLMTSESSDSETTSIKNMSTSTTGYPSVESILQSAKLQELTEIFLQNGFEDVDIFLEVDGKDLDQLGIFDPLIRASLLNIIESVKSGSLQTPTLPSTADDSTDDAEICEIFGKTSPLPVNNNSEKVPCTSIPDQVKSSSGNRVSVENRDVVIQTGSSAVRYSHPFTHIRLSSVNSVDKFVQVMLPVNQSQHMTQNDARQKNPSQRTSLEFGYNNQSAELTQNQSRNHPTAAQKMSDLVTNLQEKLNIDEQCEVKTPTEQDGEAQTLRRMLYLQLKNERISLLEEPYSLKDGTCGIPPLLIQRYSDELHSSMPKVAMAMEEMRIGWLQQKSRPFILCDNLPSLVEQGCEILVSSTPDMLTSIGLPMYTPILTTQGYSTIPALLTLSNADIKALINAPRKHGKRIVHAVEWMRKRITANPNME